MAIFYGVHGFVFEDEVGFYRLVVKHCIKARVLAVGTMFFLRKLVLNAIVKTSSTQHLTIYWNKRYGTYRQSSCTYRYSLHHS